MTGQNHPTNIACERCLGALELVTDGEISGRRVPFLACTGCEYCQEVEISGWTARDNGEPLDFVTADATHLRLADGGTLTFK